MASGSSSRCGGSGAQASSSRARAAEPLAPQLNPSFVGMPATNLVAHLMGSRRTDEFADAALVLADRERRLAEAEERNQSLQRQIRALEHCALEAEDKIRRAADKEAVLQAKIRTLQLGAAALISSGFSALGLTLDRPAPHVVGSPVPSAAALISSGVSGGEAPAHGRQPDVPPGFITASDDGVGFDDAAGVQTIFAEGGVGGGDVPMHVGAPLPVTLIDDQEKRAGKQVATDVLSCNEVAQADHEVSQDFPRARVTLSGRRKVSEEEAHGEDDDVAVSRHKHSQGEQLVATATKKACRLKGTCFTTATAAPALNDGSPEVEDNGGATVTSRDGARPKRPSRPNKQYSGPEWDVHSGP